MAALNFVAADDGLEDDPKLQALARLLTVSRPMAFWFVMRWQRLILQRGHHLLGSLPRNYTGEDIAAFLEFKGNARRLTDAMKKQGFLGFKKGRGFFYPGWNETTTGRYASRREEDRRWHEQKRKQSRSTVANASADIGRPSADASAGGLTTSTRDPIERKETSDGLPPDPPPPGGASLADARWIWVEKHAPTPQNSKACKAILAGLSDDHWGLVQRAYGLLRQEGVSISKKNLRVLQWPTDQFLRKEAYLRFRPRERPSRKATTSSGVGAASDALAEIERRISASDEFRERWLADPANKARLPPWSGRSAELNGSAALPSTAEVPPQPEAK